MRSLNRRRFLQLGSLTSGLAVPRVALGAAPPPAAEDRRVRLSGDGLGLTPLEYSALVHRLIEERGVTPDSYSLGGIVEQLEEECAHALGKERAIFMPTGTLANHMAVRALAGGASRVIVQEQSHLYQDEGDCAQTLSSLTLMPLGPGRATFTADEVQRLLDETKAARVVPRVSAISIETPVRRRQGQRFDPVELKKIIAIARRDAIRLHLDGARLFLESAYSGDDVAEYCKPFDTVYVSLYKGLEGVRGAILAGDEDTVGHAGVWRQRLGGALPDAWPLAVAALIGLDEVLPRMAAFRDHAVALVKAIAAGGVATVVPEPPQTPLFHVLLPVDVTAATKARDELIAEEGVQVFSYVRPASVPNWCGFEITVSENSMEFAPAEVASLIDELVRRARR